jgi:S-adenosylmethionine:tRNA ribosyltransferase-isomerase
MLNDDIETYAYDLPADQIAKEPAANRPDARLMVLNRADQTIEHRSASDLPSLLQPGDRMVLNETRVLPARLIGFRTSTGGKWEGLYLHRAQADSDQSKNANWNLIGQTRGRLKNGESITLNSIHDPSLPPLELKLLSRDEQGIWEAVPSLPGDPVDLLANYGTMPLPPYMDRGIATESDFERYQTTFGVTPGSVAAPTAGLHFTKDLLADCEARKIDQSRVTLHVGIGTFRPINVDRLSDHDMHSEWCELTSTTAAQLNETRKSKGRIVAIGTTSVRTLETAAQDGEITAWSGSTKLFIRPPYQFKAVDCLLTNFHLPKSTLLVLVSTFAGIEFVRDAYRTAIEEGYRFYSYGDAMLIL